MKMPLTDNQLMKMFADHDDDVAFERLYHKYKDALVRFSYGYTFNQARAEEFAHDTFLKVYRYKKKYDPEKTFRTWLWTICKNTNLDALDKHPIRREESLDQIHLDIVDVDEDALTKMVSEASREEIAVVINTLPLTQREALNLWMNDDLSFDEIGVIFEKLAIEKGRPKLFSDRLTWALSGFATLTVLFIAVTNYHTPIKRSFNHTEYISSAIEIQNSLNEDISGDDLDLTSLDYDEI